MIELPEACVIARQISTELQGKRIVYVSQGNTPHKFAFYSRSPEDYQTILEGRTIGEAVERGSSIAVCLEPDYVLVLGGGGERIRFHTDEKTIPKKYQLLLRYADDTCLTVSVQGWGNVLLLQPSELSQHAYLGEGKVSPLDAAFTLAYFQRLFAAIPPGDHRSLKQFIISEPGVRGIGNGYLQDILFQARLHPKRRAADLRGGEIETLYDAIQVKVNQAIERGGRDTEYDLYGCPGRYVKVLDNRTVGHPCPMCGAIIEKTSFLGGTVYFCPRCQVAS